MSTKNFILAFFLAFFASAISCDKSIIQGDEGDEVSFRATCPNEDPPYPYDAVDLYFACGLGGYACDANTCTVNNEVLGGTTECYGIAVTWEGYGYDPATYPIVSWQVTLELWEKSGTTWTRTYHPVISDTYEFETPYYSSGDLTLYIDPIALNLDWSKKACGASWAPGCYDPVDNSVLTKVMLESIEVIVSCDGGTTSISTDPEVFFMEGWSY